MCSGLQDFRTEYSAAPSYAGIPARGPCGKCECSASHIGQIENGRVKPSLEMTVRIANALNATTDQLLAHEFSHPEEIYLKKISERIEKYPVSKRILACEGFNTYLDSLEKFSKT